MSFWASPLMMALELNIGALLTLAYFSFLIKENRFFRFAEASVIGTAGGNLVVVAITTLRGSLFEPLIHGKYLYIIPLILGILLFTRYYKKYAYLTRYPVALILGVGVALGIRGTIDATIVGQTRGVIMLGFPTGNVFTTVNNFLMIIATLTTLCVFFFTFRTGTKFLYVQRIGRLFIMVAIGGILASQMFGQFSILIARIKFLLLEWLKLKPI